MDQHFDSAIDWRLYGSIDLQKSLTDTDDGLTIKGVVLADDQDSVGETPVFEVDGLVLFRQKRLD